MAAVPGAIAVAFPDPSTLAIEGADELQVAVLVRSCVVPSLNTPVALNFWLDPAPRTGAGGESAIPTRNGVCAPGGGGGCGWLDVPPPPQPVNHNARTAATDPKRVFFTRRFPTISW
jgi:hypothetical protein